MIFLTGCASLFGIWMTYFGLQAIDRFEKGEQEEMPGLNLVYGVYGFGGGLVVAVGYGVLFAVLLNQWLFGV